MDARLKEVDVKILDVAEQYERLGLPLTINQLAREVEVHCVLVRDRIRQMQKDGRWRHLVGNGKNLLARRRPLVSPSRPKPGPRPCTGLDVDHAAADAARHARLVKEAVFALACQRERCLTLAGSGCVDPEALAFDLATRPRSSTAAELAEMVRQDRMRRIRWRRLARLGPAAFTTAFEHAPAVDLGRRPGNITMRRINQASWQQHIHQQGATR